MKFLNPEDFAADLNRIFDELKVRFVRVLPNCEVDHIGSSAIEGAISKGDLDILVRVDKRHLSDSVERLQSLGFEIKQGTLRTDELCMLFTTEFAEDVSVQLIAKGSAFEDFLHFRDKLNANRSLVREYNELKLRCASLSPDEYRAEKSKFIERVLSS